MAGFPDGRVPVLLSAHAEELIAADARAILDYLDRAPDTSVSQVAATLLRIRRTRRHRAVVRAADTAELRDGLRALAVDGEHPLVSRSVQANPSRTAFVFPGQGNQWPSMGVEAYRIPAYRAEVDRCAEQFVAAGAESPLAYLLGEQTDDKWSQIQTQAAQFTHAVGLAAVWRSCGITPDLTVGHSLGEVAAAYLAGTVTLPDAAAIVVARATTVAALPGEYGMGVLGVALAEAEQLCAGAAGWLEVSVVNAESSVVVSGDRGAVEAVVAGVTERGGFARLISVDFPAHTSALEPLRADLIARLPGGRFADSAVPFIGSATGDVVAAGTGFAEYWYTNLRNAVRFDKAAATATNHGARAFVELSAHPALLFALGSLVDDGEQTLMVGSGHRDEPLIDALSANIAAAAVADPGYRWSDLVDVTSRPLRGFPNAPMRAVHLWAVPEPLAPVPSVTIAAETWTPATELPATPTGRRIALVELAGPAGPLADRLRDAVREHHATDLVEPADADLLVAVAPVLDHPDVEQAAADLARLTGAGLFDYAGHIGPHCRDVWLITVGGEHVRPDEPAALPAQAALAAAHRCVGFEHPDQTFRHLDLATWEPDPAAATRIVDTVLGAGADVALRESGSQTTQFFRGLVDVAEPPPAWPLDGERLADVVITGGSGAVGLHYARHLAANGARRIVLLSRSGVDTAVLDELRALGADVLSARCDVTSAEQVRAAAQAHAGSGASLLVHAAGAATFCRHDELTPAAFADTAAAKLGGLARITESWPLRPDARVLVCSSVSGLWGGLGHAAYSAANRMLDVLAGQLRGNGIQCTAVRFGLWGTGIVDPDEVARIERSGLSAMDPEAAIEASLRDHPGEPLVMAADRDRLSILVGGETETDTDTGTAPDADIAVRVVAELAAALNLDAENLDLQTSLLDLGVDSLLALDLRKRLQRVTGHKVALATLLGGITGDQLIADLDTKRSEKVDTRD
ncbi:mycobactin polyketide synthase MbtD [Mycolicibacterium flavescens]|uniref:Polyketide synthase n=1 Tax=Mycolicibacterium flavescens TaxID=1776 RepID=A0A1E3RP46_MYCFV|nr:mycobactin polyketide synthase MbtD [Mycolicibacterium flavescens]MCV7281307.1 mycobactin polyketide synthase MbtD [Mycolicibacterium flavescens]ODQ91182.1 polyketide synthase [Mycolicibacterium flavescens]